MKLIDIVNTYKATESLSDVEEFNSFEQWAIYKFRKAARTHVEFYDERMEKIRAKYIKLADKDGNLSLEDSAKYSKEANEINNFEVEFNHPKETLRIVKGVTFKTIESLDMFFDFQN